MLDWSHPALLPLLVLLPLLRWVHRRRVLANEIPVAALFLWPETEAAVGDRRAQKYDARWRRRAAMLAVLVIGAAGPSLIRPGSQTIDVHFDDAPSMRARETDGPRLALATRALVAMLRQAQADQIRIVSVRQPNRTLLLNPRAPDGWSATIQRWADVRPRAGALPMPGELAASREHWLVTDGADPALAEWIRDAPIARVIRVGTATENVAITLLATRPHLDDRGRLRGVVAVANAGNQESSRRLEVFSDDHMIASRDLSLRPGEVAEQSFDVPDLPGTRLHAVTTPHDAVVEDDEQTLEVRGPLTVNTRVDPQCGPHLLRALRAHPALSVVDGASTDVAVSCSDAPSSGDVPTLWFRRPRGGPDDAQLFPVDATAAAILARGHEGTRVLEVPVDMERPDWIRQPDYPAFVAELLDRFVGRPLLDPIASRQVPRAAIRIAPSDLEGKRAPPTAQAGSARFDLVRAMLAIAVLVLVFDLMRTRRAR